MFNSTILDLAIGLVFTFLAVSLAASAITETIASAIKWRSKTLMQGVKDLLNDRSEGLGGLALAIYNHGLVNPRANGTADTASPPPTKTLPAYIDPHHFAHALMDVTGITGKAGVDQIKTEVNKIPDEQLKRLLTGIIDRSGGTVAGISDAIAKWFDVAMDRVSGAYKRWSQLISFLVALVLVVVLNISAVHVTERLWRQPVNTTRIAQIKAEDVKKDDAKEMLDQLGNLAPSIGWLDWTTLGKFWCADLWSREAAFDAWTRVLGWVITALATLFGAAFWFDALQQIIRLKGAGPSPAEKNQHRGAAA